VIGQGVILVIMYVETFKTDVIVFIGSIIMYLTSHWAIIFGIRIRSFILTISLGVECHFQQYFSLYHGGQFYWWRKAEYPEKTSYLPQVTDKLYRILFNLILYLFHEDFIQPEATSSSPHIVVSTCAGIELTILVVIGTDYIGSCKSNYNTITTTTAP